MTSEEPRKERDGLRAFLCLAAAAVCLGAGSYYIHHSPHWRYGDLYTGEVAVAHEGWERTAVRPSGGANAAFAGPSEVYLDVPAPLIRFHNPDTVTPRLDPQQHYDVVQLPFELHLEDYEILEQAQPAREVRVSGPGGEEVHSVTAGSVLEVGDDAIAVEEVGRWAGLVRDPRGSPMVSLSLREEGSEWSDPFFVREGAWTQWGAEQAITLDWHGSRESAERAASAPMEVSTGARWGAVDGPAVHWFGSFIPGTGVELSDGRIVTLIRAATGEDSPEEIRGPAILVEVAGPDGVAREWVPPNAEEGDSPVVYEDPALLPTVIAMHGWGGEEVIVSIYRWGVLAGTMALEGWDWMSLDDPPYDLRLNQAKANAVPVQRSESPFGGALLTKDGEPVLELREGLNQRWKDHLLEYSVRTPPPAMAYHFRVDYPESGLPSSRFSLRAGEPVRLGDWVLEKGPVDPLAIDKCIVLVDYAPTREALLPAAATGITGLALLCGSLWITARAAWRRFGWRRRPAG